ncbi:glycosyltransferase [Mitsuokella sp.]|uniref:glycosyltransferase n=1 Tax=Mitsuokella sp. TaxID=2049034 RepID=UPI003D7ED069
MDKENSREYRSDIGCVIVTFNRLNKLKKTLSYYANQLLLPQYVIVVDNASSDGTKEYLDAWQKQDNGFQKIIVHSDENLGGSGGFYLGERIALNQNADWIMIADDDAYPDANYIKGIQKYINTHKNDNISIVCGRVDENGTCENIHRSQWKSKWDCDFHIPIRKENYNKAEFYPDFVSYVGIVINRGKMQLVGLVDKENFIWCDDTEHTYRLSCVGKLICLPTFRMYHDVDLNNSQLSWKSYYGMRNDLIFFKKHFPIHYPFVLFKLFVKTLLSPLKGRSMIELRMRLVAMKDSFVGNMGKNKLYKPGWKFQRNKKNNN